MFDNTLRFRFLMVGALFLAACATEPNDDEGEVSTEDLAATAIENLERALRGTLRAGSFLADSEAMADSLGAVGGDSESCEYPPCSADGTCPPAVCVVEEMTVEDLRSGRDELDDAIDELVAELRDEYFTAENLESEDDDAVTFLLGPEQLCGESYPTSSGDPADPVPAPEPTPVLDPECVDSVLRMQPRLRLSSSGEHDVEVEVLLTAQRRNLVTLELGRDRAAVVLDLGEVKGTLDAAAVETEGLVSLDGKVSFEIRRNAELDYSLSTNLLEDVIVVVDDDSGPIRVSLGSSAPSGELRLDGNARKITGRTDLGRFSLSGPLNAFRDMFDSQQYDELGNPLPQKTYVGDIELVVPGLEGQATYDGDADSVSFTGFGLGDASSTLKFNGITLAELDLNENLGRHFDVGIENPATGGPILTLSPGFDLSVLLNFTPVSDQIDDLASYLLNDTLRVWFDGTNPRVQVDDEQFRVVSGTLNFSSAAAPSAAVSVQAGMCLVEIDPPSSAHELLGAIGAGVCQGP